MTNKDGMYSTKIIAELFDLSERSIERLVQKKVIRQAGRGLFDLGSTVRDYVRHLRLNESVSKDDLDKRLTKAHAEEREAKAEMAKLDLSVMQGRLHEADHVKKIMADMVVACRSRMLAIPSRASTALVNMTEPSDIAEYLQGLIYEALDALAEYDPEQFNEMNEKYVPPYAEEG